MGTEAHTVKAVWSGPFEALLADGSTVKPGETADVSEDQLASAHWQSVRVEQPARVEQPRKETD
jgi:hypothetical protein